MNPGDNENILNFFQKTLAQLKKVYYVCIV